jgi:hypothetical protein
MVRGPECGEGAGATLGPSLPLTPSLSPAAPKRAEAWFLGDRGGEGVSGRRLLGKQDALSVAFRAALDPGVVWCAVGEV